MYWEHVGHTGSLPEKLSTRLEQALEPGERVIWLEQPDLQRQRRRGFAGVPVGLAIGWGIAYLSPWTRGGLYWASMILVPFALIFLFLPLLKRREAEKTLYVITNRRALILSPGANTGRTYPVRQVPDLTLRARRDGWGDLLLEREAYIDTEGDQMHREHRFEDVRDVGMVHYILENLALGKDPELVRRHASLWTRA